MRILVTGVDGRVGRAVETTLAAGGHQVVGFDRARGDDVLRLSDASDAAAGCDGVVHLAAIPSDDIVGPTQTIAENLAGTFNVIEATRTAGITRFVFMSSIQATGVAQSHRPPDFLPLDDSHPGYARMPYALSKLLGEQICAQYTRSFPMTTVCLRPPTILGPDEYDGWEDRRRQVPEVEDFAWNYGSWIDSRDVATAVMAALESPVRGHHVLLIAAADIAASRPGREVLAELFPTVPWRGGAEYEDEPFRSLVDWSGAARLLGWAPQHRWRRND